LIRGSVMIEGTSIRLSFKYIRDNDRLVHAQNILPTREPFHFLSRIAPHHHRVRHLHPVHITYPQPKRTARQTQFRPLRRTSNILGKPKSHSALATRKQTTSQDHALYMAIFQRRYSMHQLKTCVHDIDLRCPCNKSLHREFAIMVRIISNYDLSPLPQCK
jgi:hypothetical protein